MGRRMVAVVTPMDGAVDMHIRISDLEKGPGNWVFPLSHAWLSTQLQGMLSEQGTGQGEARLTLSLSGTTVTVTGRVDARFQVPCSRCLAPADVTVKGPFRLVLVRGTGPDGQDEDMELGPEDLELAYYEGDELDLGPYIREHLALAIPIAPLCRPDCWPEWFDGKVQSEDANDEEAKLDPRWAPLAALASRMNGE